MLSNAVIVNGARVPLPDAVRSAGGRATNYLDDGEPCLRNGPRVKPLRTFVLHETAGNTASGCKHTLVAKRIGVHLILDKDGAISNHADLATDVCWHAGQANAISVGMEVVNAYRPESAQDPRGPVLPAEWWTWVPKGQARLYQAPTDAQVRVACALVPWLCQVLEIPLLFPTAGLDARHPHIAGWRKSPFGWSAKPGMGVVEHSSFSSHADGRYLLKKVMEAVG